MKRQFLKIKTKDTYLSIRKSLIKTIRVVIKERKATITLSDGIEHYIYFDTLKECKKCIKLINRKIR